MRLESWRKIESFNKKHPEKMEDEVFFGNMTRTDFESFIWQTKRIGEAAYDDAGAKLETSPQQFPIFVKKNRG